MNPHHFHPVAVWQCIDVGGCTSRSQITGSPATGPWNSSPQYGGHITSLTEPAMTGHRTRTVLRPAIMVIVIEMLM